MKLSIQLAEAFLEIPGGVLSIHQVSKRLGIPYGTAYNRIHEMGEMGCIQITPQGKAKLCTLNPENPMTAALLALGASQATRRFLTRHTPAAAVAAKLRDLIDNRLGDHLHTAILLNLESFTGLGPASETPTSHEEQPIDHPGPGPEEAVPEATPFSLDLFLIMAEEGLSDPQLEMSIQGIFPPHLQPRISYMTVTGSTLLGMLREKENEAGLAAYHMLRRGLILLGFEKFFGLLLRAFPPKLL